jgi:hypothetical protein
MELSLSGGLKSGNKKLSAGLAGYILKGSLTEVLILP